MVPLAEKDLTTKTLESHNSVFADIVNCLLFNGEKIIDEKDLTPADNESQYKADGKLRAQERDVSKFWRNANINIAFIGIENQVMPDELMPMRIMNYDSAVYRSQYTLRTANKISNCYPVITLVIYFGKADWKYGKDLLSCINVPEALKPFVNNYRMNFYSIKDMTTEQIEMFESDFRAIAEFFSALNNGTQYHPTDKLLEYPTEVIDMISVFSGDERFRNEYNSLTDNKGGVKMCELYDRILQEGEAKGRAEGRAEGEAKGRAEGIISTLSDLVKKGLITIVQASEQAKMSVEEFSKVSGLSL